MIPIFSMTMNMPDDIYIKIRSILMIEIIFLLTSVSPNTIEFAALYILNSLETAVRNKGNFAQS